MGRAYVFALVHHHDGREAIEKRLSLKPQAGQLIRRFPDTSLRELGEERPAKLSLLRSGTLGPRNSREVVQRIGHRDDADLFGS